MHRKTEESGGKTPYLDFPVLTQEPRIAAWHGVAAWSEPLDGNQASNLSQPVST